MHLKLRELLHRLPRYLVMVNPARMRSESGDWQKLGTHATVQEALRECSAFMSGFKYSLGMPLANTSVDLEIEPWIRVVDRVENRTVVWGAGSQLHFEKGLLEHPAHLPQSKTSAVPIHLLQVASSGSLSCAPPSPAAP